MRLAIGGVSHETSTFAPTRTGLAGFENGFGLFRGRQMLDRFRGTNTCAGGFLQAAEEEGWQVEPLLWTFAYPSGLIERAVYDALKGEFLDRLRRADAAGRLDAVLLDLHGAMVVEGIDDGDGDFVAAVRQVVGDRPVVFTQDLHANHTRLRIEAGTALIGYDTYPHVDMAQRGIEAARLAVAAARGEVRPVMALRTLPLFWSAACQVTAHPPMNEVMDRVHALEQRPGMLSVTLATGFPWADVPQIGASVVVVADGDRSLAQSAADELGDWIWENRARWYQPPLTVREAIAEGDRIGRTPILLADMADNTGGGAPGDSTEALRTLLEQNVRDALVLYMADAEAARQAHAVGVGGRFHAEIGGKSHPLQGPPVPMDLEVVALSNGAFRYDGPMFAGLTGDMGPSAWVRCGGVNLVLVTQRHQPIDQAFARSLGIDCRAMRYIVVKSAVHFRSGFEAIAGSIFNVNARAIHSHDIRQLPYRRAPRLYPLEPGN